MKKSGNIYSKICNSVYDDVKYGIFDRVGLRGNISEQVRISIHEIIRVKCWVDVRFRVVNQQLNFLIDYKK